MNTKFYETSKNKRIPPILFALTLVAGAICFIVGDLALPLCVATLGALLLFDNTKYKAFSILASALIIVANIFGITFGLTFSVFGPSAVTIAFIIYLGYLHKQSKSDTALLSTIFCGAFGLVSYILLAMMLQGSYSMDAVKEFYTDIADYIRNTFVGMMSEAYAASGMQVESELLLELIDMQFYMIISYLFIQAFILVGLSFKLFGFIVRKCSTDKEQIASWRFEASSLYAYFYAILTFAILFVNSFDSFYSVAAYNLYNIFMVIFVYIGYKAIILLLTKRFSPVISNLMLIAAHVVFSSFAAQLLAVVGVIYTIRKNKEAKLNSV